MSEGPANSVKKVVLVGHCGPDSSYLRIAVAKAGRDVKVLSADDSEELKRLLSCLGKLDPEKQRIVLLAYYSGWSRDRLAQKLDIPVNTIKTWLRRSLLEIRECMGR